jgi:hypothetical protein
MLSENPAHREARVLSKSRIRPVKSGGVVQPGSPASVESSVVYSSSQYVFAHRPARTQSGKPVISEYRAGKKQERKDELGGNSHSGRRPEHRSSNAEPNVDKPRICYLWQYHTDL